MNRLIYAASKRNEDLLYATKFQAPDAFLYFEKSGTSHIVLNSLEYDRGCRQAKVDRVINLSAWPKRMMRQPRGRTSSSEDWISDVLRRHGVKRVTVSPECYVGLVDGLKSNGIKVEVAKGSLFPEREIKRKEEIVAIRHALKVTGRLLERAIGVIRSSRPDRTGRLKWGGAVLTSERVQAEIRMEAARHGFEASHPIVAGGHQSCDPHERGHGALHARELIIIDIFPRDLKTGYWGDMTRTVLKGQANEAQRKQFAAVHAAHRRAFQKLKAGVDGRSVHRDVEALFKSRGYETGQMGGRYQGFFHGTGHGLGLEIHELPRMSGVSQRLRAGHVVTVEPGLYYRATGGVRIEDVAWIRTGGCERLSHFPVQLEI